MTKGPWIPAECAAHRYGAALLEFSFVGGLCFLAQLPSPSSCQAAHNWLAFPWDHCEKCPQRHDISCAEACLWSERVPVSPIGRGSTELIPDAEHASQHKDVTHWHECVESLYFPRPQKHKSHMLMCCFPAKIHEGAGSCWETRMLHSTSQ